GERHRAGAPLREATEGPTQAVEVQPGRPPGAGALGGLRGGEGPDVRAHRPRDEPVVRGRGRRQAHGAAEPDQPPALAAPVRTAARARARRAPAAPAAPLRAPAEVDRAPRPGRLRSALSGAWLVDVR